MKYIIFIFLFSALGYGQEEVLSENFSAGIPSDWKVTSTVEKRGWFAKSYKDFNYIQMSAFGGQGKPGYKVKTELHSPLVETSDKKCKLKFAFADAFQNGQPLKVQLSGENYKPLRGLPDTAWKDLVNNSEKYDNVYEATQWIDLPALNQPYRITFVYDSAQEDKIVTTLIQLSEVDVWCEENIISE